MGSLSLPVCQAYREEETKVFKMSRNVVVDPAFKNISGAMTGFSVWRIEDMQVIPIPPDAWGKFFTGDSYIIFSSSPYGTSGGTGQGRPGVHNGRVEQHVHFWLGSETSTDEAAIAAYKSVELDEHLGGTPIQHREVQGKESKRFSAYFQKGLRYLSGGVKTGLSHYVEDLSPKLFQVKGKRRPIVNQCTSVSWSLMNQGDSYVIDIPEHKTVIIWRGAFSNRFEQLSAAKFADQLKLEHGFSDIETVAMDDGREDPRSEEGAFLELVLPLAHKGSLKDKGAVPDEDPAVARGKLKLYRCSDNSGKLILTELKDGPLLKDDLKSEDSFLIDNGNFGVWVWIGKKASEGERREAMRNAAGFIKAKGLKPETPITRVIDGGEPADFKTLFKSWKDAGEISSYNYKKATAGPGRGIAKTVQTKFDAKTLHENPKVAASTGMVDDGTGVKEVFRVQMFDLVPVPEEQHGTFFSGDCYLVLYAYSNGSKDNYIIYYWLGGDSSTDEQGTAALRTIELDDRLGGLPVQVRVVEGKEPAHFLAMFGGKMTIFQGGSASAFDGESATSSGIPSSYLLQVRGSSELSCKAVQEHWSAESLNTNDCFVVVSPTDVIIWAGKGSTGDERDVAKMIASQRNPDPEFVFEGQEKKDFWTLIGGKKPYFDQKVAKQDENVPEPRLFQVSNATGNITVEELVDFSQEDMISEDVMLLDAGHTIFGWLGAHSNKQEQQETVRIAKEYLESCPNERDGDTPIIVIKQGVEPPNFTGFFGVWEEDRWKLEELYTTSSATVEGSEGGPVVITNGNSLGGYTYGNIVPYSVLIDPEEIPESVDLQKKEEYLSEEEFSKVFGLSKEEFTDLPAWKRTALKKAKHLF